MAMVIWEARSILVSLDPKKSKLRQYSSPALVVKTKFRLISFVDGRQFFAEDYRNLPRLAVARYEQNKVRVGHSGTDVLRGGDHVDGRVGGAQKQLLGLSPQAG